MDSRHDTTSQADVGSDSDDDADRAVARDEPAASSRRRLDRAQIIDAALSFLDERPLAELTMRRLGASLGVEAMALYRHVPSRDDLLDGIVDLIIDNMYDDPDVLTTPENGWQDFLQRLAHGVRRAALAHPSAFPLMVTRPPQAPWLRPPLRSLRWVEIFLTGLIDEGFNDEEALNAYRGFTSFLLGTLLLEVAAREVELDPGDHQLSPEAKASLTEYPHLNRLSEGLARDSSKTEFEDSLDALLDRIAHLRPG